MKTTKRGVLLFGIAGMALVLGACRYGTYSGDFGNLFGSATAKVTLTIKTGHRYDIKLEVTDYTGATTALEASGKYVKLFSAFSGNDGRGNWKGIKSGKKISLTEIAYISVEDPYFYGFLATSGNLSRSTAGDPEIDVEIIIEDGVEFEDEE